jgi:hypothetical protein
MTAPTNSFNPSSASNQLHAAFLVILPRIEAHGHVCFRDVKCADRKQDLICEMVALVWRWVVRLVEKGRNPLDFPSALATFAARAVKSGRRLTGQERSRDAMSPLAQHRHRFKVEALPRSTRRSFEEVYLSAHGQKAMGVLEERLTDNTMTTPPEAAAFRIDFPDWLRTRSDRDRRLIEDMMRDERTTDLAHKHGLTAGRISQLRREFMADWDRFTGADGQTTGQPQAAIA